MIGWRTILPLPVTPTLRGSSARSAVVARRTLTSNDRPRTTYRSRRRRHWEVFPVHWNTPLHHPSRLEFPSLGMTRQWSTLDSQSPSSVARAATETEPLNATVSTATVIGQGTYANTTVPNNSSNSRYSIYQMDASLIQTITSLADLTDLVAQLERMPVLDAHDVGPLLLPLTRLTSMKLYGHDGAVLTERILLSCLARLPVSMAERYPTLGPNDVIRHAPHATTDSIVWASDATPPPPPTLDTTLSAATTLPAWPYPTVAMYNRAIIAWGNLQTSAGAERAEKLFQLQLHEYTTELDYVHHHTSMLEPWAPPPDRRCFKSLIRSWAVSSHEHGAARAHEILTVMEHLSGVHALVSTTHVSTSTTVPYLPSIPAIEMPDLGTYNVVISAYAKLFVLKHPHALTRVQDIVRRVQDLHAATGREEFILDGYSFMSILQAYSRYIQFCSAPIDPVYSRDLLALTETVHTRIRQQVAPTVPPRYDRRQLDGMAVDDSKGNVDTSFLYPLSMTRLYSVLVEVLVKTHPLVETIELATDILLALTGQHNRINTPEATTGTGVPTPICIPYEICGPIWPTPASVIQVLQAWERSGLPHAAERIDQLVSAAVVDATYTRTFHLNEAMEVWCTSGWTSAPYLMERMLQRALKQYAGTHNKPTGQTFGIVMKAWMRSKLKEAPHRAELLLKLMVHLYEDKGDTWFQPREVHIRYVLTAWLQRCKDGKRHDGISGSNMYPAEHCESLVRTLSGRPWFDRMATGQYALAIRVWATQQFATHDCSETSAGIADEPNFVQRAARILDIYADSLSEGEDIPAFPCNWVLEACCRVQPTLDRRREAYDVAIQTFRRCKHNARTFTLTVQVLRSQVESLDEQHLSVIEDLCKECCASGLLTQDLIRSVVDVVSAEALQRLFGLSYQMAQMLVTARHSTSTEEPEPFPGKGLVSRLPSVLLVENLPQEWSQHADTQRKSKDHP